MSYNQLIDQNCTVYNHKIKFKESVFLKTSRRLNNVLTINCLTPEGKQPYKYI